MLFYDKAKKIWYEIEDSDNGPGTIIGIALAAWPLYLARLAANEANGAAETSEVKSEEYTKTVQDEMERGVGAVRPVS